MVCLLELIFLFKNILEIDKLMLLGELKLLEFDIYVFLMSLFYIFGIILEIIFVNIFYF